jgi:Resolvase, N terminal domain
MGSYLGYVRVSDVHGRNGDSFISPSVQRETIERLAAAKGLELGPIVEELDVSGGNKIEDRKLGELVQSIERGEHARPSSSARQRRASAAQRACRPLSRA